MVEGASALAKKLNVPDLVIGLTIVSFGTSAPEMVVNIIASLNGSADLAIGNILGSNIANIFLILGIASLIRGLDVQVTTVWKEIPLSLLCILVLGVQLNDGLFDGGTSSVLSRGDGLILISFFVIFLYYTFGMAQKGEFEAEVPEEALHMSTAKAIVYTVIGLVALPIGGHFIVEGATALARVLGWSEAVIGLVIVGVGTSLPEVAASAVAAYKGKTGIAIGNAVGSNIFNIFWVLGLSALIKPIPFDLGLNIDVLVTIFASVALFGSTFLGTPRQVARAEGAIFLLVYALYVGLRVVFGEELVQFFR